MKTYTCVDCGAARATEFVTIAERAGVGQVVCADREACQHRAAERNTREPLPTDEELAAIERNFDDAGALQHIPALRRARAVIAEAADLLHAAGKGNEQRGPERSRRLDETCGIVRRMLRELVPHTTA